MAYLGTALKSPPIARRVQMSRSQVTSLSSACSTRDKNNSINNSDSTASPQSTTNHSLCPGVEKHMDRANKISTAQKIINYEFQNEDLLWEALQTPGSGVTMLNGRMLVQGNKNLASVGDAVITLVIKLDCYKMDRSVGYMALYLATVVNNDRFSSLCDELSLTDCINGRPNQNAGRTRADTVEAIVGAVYQDSGIESARSVMRSLRIIDYAEVQ
ncbi:ribonuclease III domain-containing protein [Nemania sp. FL0031]|nr:ribonuclease III domain-containing protein [Nemania sp. FL0031]